MKKDAPKDVIGQSKCLEGSSDELESESDEYGISNKRTIDQVVRDAERRKSSFINKFKKKAKVVESSADEDDLPESSNQEPVSLDPFNSNTEYLTSETIQASINLVPHVADAPIIPNQEDTGAPGAQMLQPDQFTKLMDKYDGPGVSDRYFLGKNVHLKDVNADEHTLGTEKAVLMGSSKYAPKAVSEEWKKTVPSLAKSKHQITFLAAQAKAREDELKRMWAEGRANKRSSMMKYGF